jgi:hypothetical protein
MPTGVNARSAKEEEIGSSRSPGQVEEKALEGETLGEQPAIPPGSIRNSDQGEKPCRGPANCVWSAERATS